mmetsp:Transcript_35943/g.80010  ORF Transcript_35943/g.80010 Transcript_35943/m.80010 type:complete len:189 (-) Transcript_35943:768-1334(-)|eukprot:CAMPEP_0202892736 /NCGR_PEP_ID=MMETSP1392-20130828/2432_1 /ASSEMBLY_ACC=CAM_ASM_000868 /TAXON_ID=225041 /ORGANISM="Chlamydomonas chlamydogama, Strain SAG 11-48b" /LENGTH=188 /DNA_ID=CAMNT_0049576799 /DNA_START=130 /DNA_END=696 /DNA_ORIENTATION=-
MKSGGGVLSISAAQLLVGLCLLGIYEGYKAYYFNSFVDEDSESNRGASESISVSGYESPLDFRSPMGFSYYLAIINNVFAVFGLAGVINAQRELIVAFFAYNAAQMVISFHYFVDLCTDAGISYNGEPAKLTAYEQATTAFIFFNFLLSVAATVFAVKAIDEIKAKQRDEYNRFTVLSDTLQYEADQA